MQTANVTLPITVTGRHVEVTTAMRDFAHKKVEGLHLDYPRIIEAKVILDAVARTTGKSGASAFPLTRTLTNADGIKIKARITGRSKSKVYFTTQGKDHVYNIDQLSEADQRAVTALPINR